MDDGKFIDFSLRKCRIKSVSADNTLIVEDEDGKEEKASYKFSMICVDKKLEKVKNVHEFVELFDRLSSRIFYATIFSDLDSDLKKVRHIWTGDDFDSVSDSPDAMLEQQLDDYLANEPSRKHISLFLDKAALSAKLKLPKLNLVKDKENKTYAIRNGTWFVNGRNVKFSEIESKMPVKFYCNVCPFPPGIDKPSLANVDYLAEMAWLDRKPPEDLCKKSRKVMNETVTGSIIVLIKNEAGIATSGLIKPSKLSIQQGKIGSNTRIWFNRKNFYFYGACLENVDLSRLIRHHFNVNIHLDSSGTNSMSEQDLKNLSEFYGASDAETLEFVEGTCVTEQFFLPKILVFDNPEDKFKIRPDAVESLSRYLAQKKLSIEDFKEMVSKENRTDKLSSIISIARDSKVPATDAIHKARIVELQNPEKAGWKTSKAIMEFLSGPFSKQLSVVERSDIFIFGHCLAKANLMDLYHKGDVFEVLLTDEPLDIDQKAAIVKEVVEEKKSYAEICGRYNNVPQSLIVEWIKDAGLEIPKSFCPKGKNFEMPIKLAWIGPFTPKVGPDDTDNPKFNSYLRKHNLNFDKFSKRVQGLGKVTPYFPVIPIYAVKPLCAVVHSVYPPTTDKWNHFGLLKITKGPLTNQIVSFQPNETYIYEQNVGRVKDLSQILWAGEEIECEVRKPVESERIKWTEILRGCCDHFGKPLHLKPRYIAYLVYKGGRPTHGQKVRDVTPEDVLQNPPLCQWLVTRSIPNEAFISIVNGKALNQILPERPRKRPTEGLQQSQSVPTPQNLRNYPVQQDNISGRHIEDPKSFVPQSREQQFRAPLLSPPISNDGNRSAMSRLEDSHSFGSSPRERQNRMPLLKAPDQAVSRFGIQPVQAASRSEVRSPRNSYDYSNRERAIPSDGERVEARDCNAIMNKAEIITRRIMSCISPEDPEVDHVITNHDDLELAMFMSKTLVSSIISFTKRSKVASEERARAPSQPPEVTVVRDERYSDREEFTKAPNSVEVIELDREPESLPSMSKGQLRRQQKKAYYSSYVHGQPIDAGFGRDKNISAQPQDKRYNEFSPTVTAPMRNSPPRRGPNDNRYYSDEDHYSTLPLAARLEASSRSLREEDSYDRPGVSDLTQGVRTDPKFYDRRAEVDSRFPEIVLPRENFGETIPRRTSISEGASGEVDLRAKLTPKNYASVNDTAVPGYRGLGSIDSRSYSGTKRVGSEYSHEPAKQPRFESQYPY